VAGLRIIADTASSPTLPFVTAASTDARTRSLLRLALAEAAADPALADVRRDLFLTAIVPASIHRFVALRRLARDAAAAGYPDLR
jgi:ABC-type phosphate/phosphonate transport system substrate-binding protein